MLRQVCTNLENISNIRWSSEEVVVRVFMQHKDSKGECAASIVREFEKHSQNSLSAGGNVFLVRQRHHQ